MQTALGLALLVVIVCALVVEVENRKQLADESAENKPGEAARHDIQHAAQPAALLGEGVVVGRVPVLGRDDELEARGEPVGDRDHGVPVRHGESAARQKIVLEVHEDQRGLRHDRS